MELAKLKNSQEQVIIQITDTHLMDHADAEFVNMNPEKHFHAVMDDVLMRYPQIDAFIHTGDLAQVPRIETYKRYQAYMDTLNIPYFQIPGNHDDSLYFPFHTPEPNPTVVDLDPWCIILLNSAVKGKTDGMITTEQLTLLSQVLEEKKDKFVILACHHHPFDMHSQWLDQHKLKNTDDLTTILEQYTNIKAVLFGHVHQESDRLWNNTQFLSTPATCVQFKPQSDNFALDEITPGYRCLHLTDHGELITKVHRLENFGITINKEISGY